MDLTVKPPIDLQHTTHEVYGICELKSTEPKNPHLKRLVFKTDNDAVQNLKVNLKRSLLRKCPNITIRTDLQSQGVILMKSWLLNFMCEFKTSSGMEFTNLNNEFVSFLVKNQFKKAISKYAPDYGLIGSDDVEGQIAQIMDPMQMLVTKDLVKVQVHLLQKTNSYKPK